MAQKQGRHTSRHECFIYSESKDHGTLSGLSLGFPCKAQNKTSSHVWHWLLFSRDSDSSVPAICTRTCRKPRVRLESTKILLVPSIRAIGPLMVGTSAGLRTEGLPSFG